MKRKFLREQTSVKLLKEEAAVERARKMGASPVVVKDAKNRDSLKPHIDAVTRLIAPSEVWVVGSSGRWLLLDPVSGPDRYKAYTNTEGTIRMPMG